MAEGLNVLKWKVISLSHLQAQTFPHSTVCIATCQTDQNVCVCAWKSVIAGIEGEWWGVKTLIKILPLAALEADRGNKQSAVHTLLLNFLSS